MKKRNKTWEEAFDERFSLPPEIGDATAGIGFVPSRRPVFEPYEKVKDFIRSLLSQARKEGRREGYSKSFNQMMGNPIKQLDKLKLRKKD